MGNGARLCEMLQALGRSPKLERRVAATGRPGLAGACNTVQIRRRFRENLNGVVNPFDVNYAYFAQL